MPSLSGKVSALPTEEVIAFPFGEGVGIADRKGHSLPIRGRCRHCRRKRTMPSFSEKVSALPTEEVIPSFLGKVSALPTEEVIAFPFGEGVGFADGRGLCDRKCPHSAELSESKNKKVRALCRIWYK